MSEIISLHSSNAEDEEDYLLVRVYKLFFPCDETTIETNDVDVQKKDESRYKTNSFTQLRWLIWRNFVNIFKNPFEIRLRIILSLVCF
jgi:hypothetical protein